MQRSKKKKTLTATERAKAFDRTIIQTVKALRKSGKKSKLSYAKISFALNQAGIKSRFGKRWHSNSVARLIWRNKMA